jgi:exopolysaccharide biosynthesis polyprenyl glycosylphosphotransferase
MEFSQEMNASRRSVNQSRIWQLRIAERRALLVVGDFLMAVLALGFTLLYWGTSERFMGFSMEFIQKRTPLWFFLLPIVWIILLVELYDVHRAGDWKKTVRGVAMAALVGLGLYLVVYFYYVDPPNSLLPRRGVASYLVVVSLLTLAWRWVYIRVLTKPQFMRRVLLVGAGSSGRAFLRIYNQLEVKSFQVFGIIDDDHRKLGETIEGVQVVATSEQILNLIEEKEISEIIVAITREMQAGMFQALLDCQERGIIITRMPVAYEELLERVPVLSLEANWILRAFVDHARVSSFYEMGKRLIDIIGATIGILLMVIVFPMVALAVILDDGLPIFYTQVRSGRGGQTYMIIKFRTMQRDAEPDGRPRWAKEGDRRATRVGRFLRKTHLDELPQFINVFRGEMSLVGPRAERPELVEMFQQHIPFYRARLLVKPGITGWAQVNYGYASTIDETRVKLEYDLYYIKRRNLWMDIMILVRTPFTVLGLRGR